MKEITFLKQNAQKWEAYEELIKTSKKIPPSKLAEMFVEITDDLSYANTNYKQSKTTTYINSLASQIHQLVYRNKRESGNRFISFYTRELPQLFGQHHKQLLYSFIVTAIATLIGVLSQLYDDHFVRLVLGDEYVDATIERIKQGNPIGVYAEGNPFLMFVAITKNNISVAFTTFVLGMLTAFGTAFIILQNGIMLGCFFTLFYQYNVLDKALKVVWIHGTLEISAIIIAGCAGFILGNSFVFPGTLTRIQALKNGGKAGVKISVGLVPVFICAGFLEGFVTRYTNMPLALTFTIIFISLGFILFYFVFWPYYLRKKMNNQVN